MAQTQNHEPNGKTGGRVCAAEEELFGTETIVADNAFFLAFDNLYFVRRHLPTRFQAGKVDLANCFLPRGYSRNIRFGLAGDQAFRLVIGISNGGTGDIESYVGSADHDYPASNGQPSPSDTARRKSLPP